MLDDRFECFAFTPTRRWPTGIAPRHRWLFWPTIGYAHGHVTIDADGVSFRPGHISRRFGMREALVRWADIEMVYLASRQGVNGATLLGLRHAGGVVTFATFRRRSIERTLRTVRHSIDPFPDVVSD